MKPENNLTSEPFADALWEHADIPERLWHYTDGAGLIGIAATQSLWCTEYRYLNDRDEIATFAEHLYRKLQTFLSTL